MKKSLLLVYLSIVFILDPFIMPSIQNSTYAGTSSATYAKWGKIAIKETIQKYSDAEVIDYLHRGKQDNGDSTIEKFKLWLRGKHGEFGVFVNIEYNTETEKILNITIFEADQ